MSAAEALKAARTVGIELVLDGNDLLWEATSEPPAVVLDGLSRHKAEIVAILRPSKDGWSAEDWRLFFEERAAVTEYDGGLPRNEAEAQAFECCVVKWLDLNPTPSARGHCAWCGQTEANGAVVVRYGTEPGTHASLHTECWPAWQELRRSQALEALTRIGIGRLSDACSEPMECDQCGKSTGTVQQAWICDPGGQPITARLHRECEAAFLQQLEPSWGLHRIIAVDALTDPVTIYLGARPLAGAPIRPRFSPNGLATSEVTRPEWRCRVWRPHVVPSLPVAP